MDELEKRADAILNHKITNDKQRTLCIFASEPIGIVDDLLEIGGIYQLSEALAPLICRDIIDYAKFEDHDADAMATLNCKKIAFFHHEEAVAKRYRRKASQKQEKTLAKKFGGRTTPGSGALGFFKGDVDTKDYLIEAKFTDAQEYRLTLKTWNKIKNEAYSVDKIPLIEICIDQDGTPVKLILIAPTEFYEKFDIENDDAFIERFYSFPLVANKNAQSIMLNKSLITTHIEDVTYNYESRIPTFLINIGQLNLIGIETTDFVRIINK